MSSKKRINEIDIVKAIAIILMVAAHAGFPFSHFIYLFHMPVFFIASGFVYKSSCSQSLRSVGGFVLKKIRHLYLPFVIANSVFVLLNNVFIDIHIYTDNPDILQYVSGPFIGTHEKTDILTTLQAIGKGFVFMDSCEICGALWFLGTLFWVSVAFCAADFIMRKLIKKPFGIAVAHIVTALGFLAAGYICSVKDVYVFGLERAASCYCFFALGNGLFKVKDIYQSWNWKQFLPVFAGSFSLLLVLNRFGSVSMDNNVYTNPFFLLAAVLLGWGMLYSAAYFINKSVIKQPMLYIGKRTLPIMLLHFLAFKPMAAFIVFIYRLPVFCVAAFPTLYGDRGCWWLAYTIAGIALPLLAYAVYRKCVGYIHNKYTFLTAKK